MAKITIIIGGHLCTAPRALKEAQALSRAGHSVKVIGVTFEKRYAGWDQHLLQGARFTYQSVLDLRCRHSLSALQQRAQRKLAQFIYRKAGYCLPELYGYGTQRLYKAALKENADLTIVHSEAGLWIAAQLIDHGQRVGVDFEDWFSQDLPLSARTSRPVEQLEELERQLAKACRYRLVTSQAMAEQFAAVYECAAPLAIPNAVSALPLELSANKQPRLHWFSQTLGRNRGIEQLLQALNSVTYDCEIYLRGNCSTEFQNWIKNNTPERFKEFLYIQPSIPPWELPISLRNYDIGLALETATIGNKNYTISNKLFQYYEAGLAVIATATAGQSSAWSKETSPGELIAPDNAEALASAINCLLGDPEKRNAARCNARRLHESRFDWSKFEPQLVEACNDALRS